jgi:hypothetical protein
VDAVAVSGTMDRRGNGNVGRRFKRGAQQPVRAWRSRVPELTDLEDQRSGEVHGTRWRSREIDGVVERGDGDLDLAH